MKGIIKQRPKKTELNEQAHPRLSAMDPTLREAFYNDVYSNHFNHLRFLGQWNHETGSTLSRKLYQLYRCFIIAYGAFLSLTALMDLYNVRTDFKKVVFNVCTTSLITGILIKNVHVQLHSKRVNELRINLFKDAWSQRENPEDIRIRDTFVRILLQHKRVFYFAAFSLVPLWLITSLTTLIWGPRQLPFSVWTPVDLEDDFQFFCGFMHHAVGSVFIAAETIQADLAMYSLFLQIAAQYGILAKNVYSIGDIYKGKWSKNEKMGRDVNKVLSRHKAKERLRECVQRQMVLIGYIKEVEAVYSKPMMLQLFCAFVLTIGNGLELIVVSMSFSMKLSYQVGYTVIIVGDMFMCCNLADLLSSQRQKVVWSYYDTVWYEMDSEIRKHLNLAIIGAQRMQPLTAAKMFSLNLTTFLGLLRNTYSWLALFRQLLLKK